MSVRPSSSNFRRAALTGLTCLAMAMAARAGEGARAIEVVPFHGTSMDTNFEQSAQDNLQTPEVWRPTAPQSMAPSGPANRMTLLPRPQQPALSKKDQQLLDRRRNWVFMTPEDYANSDPNSTKNLLGIENEEDNMSPMERYYRRLEKSGKSTATNQFSRLNPDGMTGPTNFLGSVSRNSDSSPFDNTPFSPNQQTGVFQPITGDTPATIFGGDNVKRLSPEEVRIQAEQKAHMESFKQLWNINEANGASTVSAPASGPIDSAPLFGASAPGMSSPFKPAGSPGTASSPASQTAPQQVVAPRASAPPRPNFTVPQREF